MNLNSRVERLESRLNPQRTHVFELEGGETELEASTRYCTKNGLELEKFENCDYGKVIMIVYEALKPGGAENGA